MKIIKKASKVVYDKNKSDKLLSDVKKLTAKRGVQRQVQAQDRMKRAVQAGKVGRFSNGVGVGY